MTLVRIAHHFASSLKFRLAATRIGQFFGRTGQPMAHLDRAVRGWCALTAHLLQS
jgi:hypothetical protein